MNLGARKSVAMLRYFAQIAGAAQQNLGNAGLFTSLEGCHDTCGRHANSRAGGRATSSRRNLYLSAERSSLPHDRCAEYRGGRLQWTISIS